MNKLSQATREIVVRALKGDTTLPFTNELLIALARESYDEPERPKTFALEKVHGEEENSEVAVLVTGGLDSTTLYFRALEMHKGRRIVPVYVYIGQPYFKKEIEAIQKLGIPVHVDNQKLDFGEQSYWKHIIPGRNLYFLSLTAEHMEGGTILFGATEGEIPEQGGDKSEVFLRLVNQLFAQLPYPVTVEAPLRSETKTDLVKWWVKQGKVEQLRQTISCFTGETRTGHCGSCQACLRKYLAFLNNGLVLEVDSPDIRVSCAEYIAKYKDLMPKVLKTRDFSHYSRRRCLQDLRAIRRLESA